MFERRVFALLGFILALLGGILVLVGALSLGRWRDLDLATLARGAVEAVLGIAAIFGGLIISKGRGMLSRLRMRMGGLVTVIIGVVLVILTEGLGLGEILIIVGGILGIVGAEV